MMPHWLSVLFLLLTGVCLLVVAYHGYRVGELRGGTNLWCGVYRPTRKDNPLIFYFFLILYFSAGMSLCLWGLLSLLGMAPDIKFR
ncbi:Uncharacterised protein [Fluoribacter dumoffii]|uniref:Uncharacterized protein n=1 Tax=Fluoribacter dumoffii TaxID=463 RepID=A0A377G7X0_9GAMM|nr:hypothetical protein Ldum_0879 [Fluoribacter dumoffii NY 23]STO20925.1 Uncharacterised protein [Fluoribacter dumoffii]